MNRAQRIVVALSALLLFAPVAVAEEADCQPTASSPCPSDTANGDDAPKRDSSDNTTTETSTSKPSSRPTPDSQDQGPTDDENDAEPQEPPSDDEDDARPERDPPKRPDRPDRPQRDRDHVTFERVPGHVALKNYTVDDLLVLDGAAYRGPGNATESTRGAVTMIQIGDDRITFTDSPTGILGFKAGRDGQGAFILDFPDDATFKPQGRSLGIELGERRALIVFDNGSLDGDRLTVQGFVALHVLPDRDDDQEDDRVDVSNAIADRKVAAQVDVEDDEARIETYDDVEVTVQGGDAPVTRDQPLRIEISGDLPEGRTFVANIPAARLVGPDLEIRAFIVHDDGVETEVLIKQADNLADILDPSNDGGDMEYWVVKDKNGVEAILSVGHFSTHAFTVASFGEVITQPSLVFGLVAGIGASALAVGAMFWPRRQ